MAFTFSTYVTLCLLVTILVFLSVYYWITVLRKLKGFPIYHVLPYIMHYQMTRKKDSSFNNFCFQILKNMYKKHKEDGLCMSYNLSPMLYVFGEEPIKILLNHKSAIDKPPEYKVLSDGMGNGLVTSNGERWKRHRKLINTAFHMGKLKEKIPLFNKHALNLINELKTLENKPCSNFIDIIKLHSFNTLSESIFGLKLSQENKVEFLEYFEAVDRSGDIIMHRIYQPWLWFKSGLHLFKSGKQYLRIYDVMHSFAKNIILQMKKHISTNKNAADTGYFTENLHKSFSYSLLQHHLKDPSFTFEDLHSHVNTLMAAGFDTVSYSMMWALFMLGLHPEIQEKAFEEVRSSCDYFITYDEINSFTYLEAFIMETLRVYPTIPICGRSINENIQLGKYEVRKGTCVAICVYFLHRNPDVYPDPERFDPERFLYDREKKPWLHIPFAEGNRVCIGKKYAIIEMKIFLAHVLRYFKITSLDKREDIELCCSLILKPTKPIRMLITPR